MVVFFEPPEKVETSSWDLSNQKHYDKGQYSGNTILKFCLPLQAQVLVATVLS